MPWRSSVGGGFIRPEVRTLVNSGRQRLLTQNEVTSGRINPPPTKTLTLVFTHQKRVFRNIKHGFSRITRIRSCGNPLVQNPRKSDNPDKIRVNLRKSAQIRV
ncbi:MAG: hypothetical protein FWG87_00995 [Defluviitaleaceae bacterium]|nr:hypothetical protein [Defluviitaleaceae bacterium]